MAAAGGGRVRRAGRGEARRGEAGGMRWSTGRAGGAGGGVQGGRRRATPLCVGLALSCATAVERCQLVGSLEPNDHSLGGSSSLTLTHQPPQLAGQNPPHLRAENVHLFLTQKVSWAHIQPEKSPLSHPKFCGNGAPKYVAEITRQLEPGAAFCPQRMCDFTGPRTLQILALDHLRLRD